MVVVLNIVQMAPMRIIQLESVRLAVRMEHILRIVLGDASALALTHLEL